MAKKKVQVRLVVPSESPVIELPTDFERIAQLKRKLVEYQARVARAVDDLGDRAKFWAPEMVANYLGSTPYRIKILQKLLNEKKVVTWDLSKELAALDPHYDPNAFNRACGVIADYVTTGGTNLSGGTGLK